MGGGGGESPYIPKEISNTQGGMQGGRPGTSGTRSGRETGGECADIDESTTLLSPDPKVVDKLRVGTVGAVRLSTDGKILQVTFEGAIAGSIVPEAFDQIIDCIGKNVTFSAEVREIDDGDVTVRIRAK